jgi:hypothetical protein
MKAQGLVAGLGLLSLMLSGCARKPYKVETFGSPTKGMFFTVETYDGGPGPLGSDITKVYAHLQRDGKSTRIPVLEGDVTVAKVVWNSPNDDTICLGYGTTDIFHNQVTLVAGDGPDDSQTIYSHLDEHCP